jgi:hypothetical protein
MPSISGVCRYNLGLAGAAYAYALCKLANAILLMGWIAWQGQGPGMQAAPSSTVHDRDANGLSSAVEASEGTVKSASLQVSSASSSQQQDVSHHQPTDHANSKSVHLSTGVASSNGSTSSNREQSIQTTPATSPATNNLLEGITLQDVVDPRGCWEYIKFGLPSAAMTMLEWWAYEAQIIMAGTLPNAEVAVAVLGICFAISGGCPVPAPKSGQNLAAIVSTKHAELLMSDDFDVDATGLQDSSKVCTGSQDMTSMTPASDCAACADTS